MAHAASEQQSKRGKGHAAKVTWRYKKPKSAGQSLRLRKVHLPLPPCNEQNGYYI